MRKYQPWRQNQTAALLFLALACTGFILSYQNTIPAHWGLMGASIALAAAFFQYKRAGTRKFGKTFEETHIAIALAALRRSSFKGVPNAKSGTNEDIDLLVIGAGASIPVEIKSYIRWTTYVWRWHGGREQRAVAQSKRQRRHTKSRFSIIWIPQGRRGFWQRFSKYPQVASRVYLVFGGGQALVQAIHELQRT